MDSERVGVSIGNEMPLVDLALKKIRLGEALSEVEKAALQQEVAARGGNLCIDNPKHIATLRMLLVLEKQREVRMSFAESMAYDAAHATPANTSRASERAGRTKKDPYSSKYAKKNPGRQWHQTRR